MLGWVLGVEDFNLGHVQAGSYRYKSLIEGLYTLLKPSRSPLYPELPTCSFLFFKGGYARNKPNCSDLQARQKVRKQPFNSLSLEHSPARKGLKAKRPRALHSSKA